MKYMGWSWADLKSTPSHVVDEVAKMMNEENEKIEAMRN